MGVAKGFGKRIINKYNPPPLEMNVFFNKGGTGDYICRIPVVEYLLTHHTHISINLWVPDLFLDVAQHFLGKYKKCRVKPFSLADREMVYGIQAIDAASKHHSSIRTHLVDHAYHVYADMVPSQEQRNYPVLDLDRINIEKYNLPDKYIVLTTGYTAPIRQWEPRSVNTTAKWCLDNGYSIVWLGSKSADAGNGAVLKGYFNSNIDYSVGLDLIGQTSLLEAGKVLANSRAVVGVDNGLCHLAACSLVPIVMGFTSVRPEHRLPIRQNIQGWKCEPVVSAPICCQFCQSDWLFSGITDFTKCPFGTYSCTKSLKPELFIDALRKVLS